jgi:hypothetical protein
MTTADTVDAYVRGALALQGYRLDEAQTGRVTAQFAAIAAIAQGFLNVALVPDDEPAPVFRP